MKTFVSIVGAGPAGLAAAVELKANGIKEVVVFEKEGDICSTIRKFYPPQKEELIKCLKG